MAKRVYVSVAYPDNRVHTRQNYIDNIAFKFSGEVEGVIDKRRYRTESYYKFPNIEEAEGFASIIARVKNTKIDIEEK